MNFKKTNLLTSYDHFQPDTLVVLILGRFDLEPSHTLQICIKRHIGNDDKNDDPGLMRSPGSKNVGNFSYKS